MLVGNADEREQISDAGLDIGLGPAGDLQR